MTEIHFGAFRTYVIHRMREIEALDYEVDSVEWFLLRYLRQLVKSIESEQPDGRVDGRMRSLVRFYVDNIDQHSELGEQCMAIHEEYRKSLRGGQTGRGQATVG